MDSRARQGGLLRSPLYSLIQQHPRPGSALPSEPLSLVAEGQAPSKVRPALTGVELLKGEAVKHFLRRGWTVCHAGAAEIDGRLVIFPGASGSGKSTLSVLLARCGYAVADEIVFLREDGRGLEAVAAPLPLSVSEETVASLPPSASWRLGPEALPGGKAVLRPPALLAEGGPVRLAVLLSRNGTRGECVLGRASRRETAIVLLENIVRHSAAGPAYATARRRAWRTFCTLLDRVPTYALRGDMLSDGGGAVRRIEQVVRGGRHV